MITITQSFQNTLHLIVAFSAYTKLMDLARGNLMPQQNMSTSEGSLTGTKATFTSKQFHMINY